MNCILCSSKAIPFFEFSERNRRYFECHQCKCIFMDPADFPSSEEEKERYLTHNNDINDHRYQQFVMPLVEMVVKQFDKNSVGLDFGAGTGPVITDLLRKKGYAVQTYDPFFDRNEERLNNTYHYIIMCEVAEHLHKPYQEFKMLRNMLKQSGAIFIKTHLYDDETDFSSWYYKNDETHVIFYRSQTLEWIKREFNFSQLFIEDRHIYFKI